ncbi:MAG: nitronate monooxygenase, partial [Chloroflexota bacterium]|nr:nitronate monooxygenase [Chloroflexota bacterium]
ELTSRPFGINHLLFMAQEDKLAATVDLRPAVFSTAWPWPEQDLRVYKEMSRQAGALFMHMVSTVPEALRAAEAGADIIVAQGTEGGGHVAWMGTFPLVPMVVRAVSPVPVLAAGGVADGAGLAAALALGAEGVLLGTRFMATAEAPISQAYKEAIVRHNGHDTLLTEIPDIARGRVWPGAMSRVARNRFIERWAGREWEVRQRRAEIGRAAEEARRRGDSAEFGLSMGQTAGLITGIEPAGQLVERIAADAERIITQRLAGLATPA